MRNKVDSARNINNLKDWNRLDSDLNEIYSNLYSIAKSPTWTHFLKLINERFSSPKQVRTIEVGCRYGKFSICANLIGCNTALIDYNPFAIEQARKLFSELECTATIEVQDALHLSKEMLEQFDISFSFGLAEYFVGEERIAVFQAHKDLVKPGGCVFIVVPNAYCFPYRITFGLRRFFGKWPRDLPEVPFSRSELLSLGDQVGLRHCRVLSCGFFWADVQYWIGENIKSLIRKMIGFPKPFTKKGPLNIHELDSNLKGAKAKRQGYLSNNFAYAIALVGDK